MTEAAFQEARKIMRTANHLRGLITNAKANVAKWTAYEDVHRRNLKHAQADGAKKNIESAIKKLEERRVKFAAIKFPDPDLKIEKVKTVQCEGCGYAIAEGNTYCGECLCEDDSE